MLGDIPHGNVLDIKADDHVIKVHERARALRSRHLGERAMTVPQHLQIHRPPRGLDRLTRQAIARVPRPAALRSMLVITQMISHLRTQSSLNGLLDHAWHANPQHRSTADPAPAPAR